MSGYFDIRTLSFVSGVIAGTLWCCMLFVARTQKVYPGFRQWTFASLSYGIGMILLSLRDILPGWLTIVVANLLIIIFFVMIASGLIEFVGGRKKVWLDVVPIAVVAATFLYFTYHSPDVSARIVIISFLIAVLCARSALIIYRCVPSILAGTNWVLLASLILMGGWFLGRSVLTLVFENQIEDFMSASVYQGLTFTVNVVGNIMLITGLIIINAQRLEHDLFKARAQVKSLTGLLPICSSCKKIRDDRGCWQDVAVYVRDRSEAEFSHGLCPECMERLYPEYAQRLREQASMGEQSEM